MLGAGGAGLSRLCNRLSGAFFAPEQELGPLLRAGSHYEIPRELDDQTLFFGADFGGVWGPLEGECVLVGDGGAVLGVVGPHGLAHVDGASLDNVDDGQLFSFCLKRLNHGVRSLLFIAMPQGQQEPPEAASGTGKAFVGRTCWGEALSADSRVQMLCHARVPLPPRSRGAAVLLVAFHAGVAADDPFLLEVVGRPLTSTGDSMSGALPRALGALRPAIRSLAGHQAGLRGGPQAQSLPVPPAGAHSMDPGALTWRMGRPCGCNEPTGEWLDGETLTVALARANRLVQARRKEAEGEAKKSAELQRLLRVTQVSMCQVYSAVQIVQQTREAWRQEALASAGSSESASALLDQLPPSPSLDELLAVCDANGIDKELAMVLLRPGSGAASRGGEEVLRGAPAGGDRWRRLQGPMFGTIERLSSSLASSGELEDRLKRLCRVLNCQGCSAGVCGNSLWLPLGEHRRMPEGLCACRLCCGVDFGEMGEAWQGIAVDCVLLGEGGATVGVVGPHGLARADGVTLDVVEGREVFSLCLARVSRGVRSLLFVAMASCPESLHPLPTAPTDSAGKEYGSALINVAHAPSGEARGAEWHTFCRICVPLPLHVPCSSVALFAFHSSTASSTAFRLEAIGAPVPPLGHGRRRDPSCCALTALEADLAEFGDRAADLEDGETPAAAAQGPRHQPGSDQAASEGELMGAFEAATRLAMDKSRELERECARTRELRRLVASSRQVLQWLCDASQAAEDRHQAWQRDVRLRAHEAGCQGVARRLGRLPPPLQVEGLLVEAGSDARAGLQAQPRPQPFGPGRRFDLPMCAKLTRSHHGDAENFIVDSMPSTAARGLCPKPMLKEPDDADEVNWPEAFYNEADVDPVIERPKPNLETPFGPFALHSKTGELWRDECLLDGDEVPHCPRSDWRNVLPGLTLRMLKWQDSFAGIRTTGQQWLRWVHLLTAASAAGMLRQRIAAPPREPLPALPGKTPPSFSLHECCNSHNKDTVAWSSSSPARPGAPAHEPADGAGGTVARAKFNLNFSSLAQPAAPKDDEPSARKAQAHVSFAPNVNPVVGKVSARRQKPDMPEQKAALPSPKEGRHVSFAHVIDIRDYTAERIQQDAEEEMHGPDQERVLALQKQAREEILPSPKPPPAAAGTPDGMGACPIMPATRPTPPMEVNIEDDEESGPAVPVSRAKPAMEFDIGDAGDHEVEVSQIDQMLDSLEDLDKISDPFMSGHLGSSSSNAMSHEDGLDFGGVVDLAPSSAAPRGVVAPPLADLGPGFAPPAQERQRAERDTAQSNHQARGHETKNTDRSKRRMFAPSVVPQYLRLPGRRSSKPSSSS